MGKAGRNETKRIAASFLNGTAVALLMAGYIGPLLAGDHRLLISVLAIVASSATHLMEARLAGYLED
jgi:hypothetical protein